MQCPENPDDKIKKLLLSEDPADWIVGLELLDETYRDEISGYIRRWHVDRLFSLTPHDLTKIWPNTLISIAENVVEGKFKSEGDLRAYVRLIAYRRAVDLLRAVLRLAKMAHERCERVGWLPAEAGEILEVIQKLVRQLPKGMRIVIQVDIERFLGRSEWPSLEELTEEVNRQISGEPLTRSAVKGRRARGRKRLRELLENEDLWYSK